MEDKEIIELFQKRQEEALSLTSQKYGRLMKSIASKLGMSDNDAEECVNDTLLQLWRNIPPAEPKNLGAYACKAVRNTALSRLEYDLAQKRDKNATLPLDELEAVLPDFHARQQLSEIDFALQLQQFLDSLSREARTVFLKRYFFFDTVPEIASDLKISKSKVTAILHRARKKLKEELLKKGDVL